MSDLHFLPYLRRGLSRHLSQPDSGVGGLAPAEVQMGLSVAGEPVGQTVGLLAPHRVASLSPSEIVRRYPAPDAVDVEWNYFPLVEFRAPDLPWRYTPAGPGAQGRLRPWLALVVVEADAPDIEYIATAGTQGELRVGPEGIRQLPPHEELWGWAHVQSSQPADQVAAAAVASPETLLSRIICPRRMEPGRAYRAALVNAFRAGENERAEPAWSASSSEPLVVFDTWTFTTATQAGDFESLCELLEPATEAGELGMRPVDVTNPGVEVRWPRSPMTIELIGALADPGIVSDDPPPGSPAFAEAVEPILNDVLDRAKDAPDAERYDPLRDDPVVGLPFYGSWPAKATEVPRAGWVRELNLRADRRIAAGLGARVVRRNQEELMAAAWDQLGSIREASDELNRGRLGAEIGRSWQARMARIEDGDRIGLAAPLLPFVRVDGKPARTVVEESLAPNALVDRVWLRRIPRATGASASSAYLRGTKAGASLLAFHYQTVAEPQGISPIEVELGSDTAPGSLFSAAAMDHLTNTDLATGIGGLQLSEFLQRRLPPVSVPRRAPRFLVAPRGQAVAAGVASAVAGINPLASVRASLAARIPVLESLLPAGELPAEFRLTPQFLDALFRDLTELDKDVLVPGLGGFPNNRVRLLAVNAGFVGAFLAGANHEMAREFLWREYPTDLTGTFFQRFFDYDDGNTVDIDPIDGWPKLSSISKNVPNAASTTAILLRGDLIRRYPDVNIFIAPQDAQRQPSYGGSVQPTFEGRLAADVLVVGFPLAPEIVLGQEDQRQYFIVLEERMTAPRFGLDVARKGELTTWDELAWSDFDPGITHIGAGEIPGLVTPTFESTAAEGGDVEWGRNAAHLAAAVHQRPFRRLYPARKLVLQPDNRRTNA